MHSRQCVSAPAPPPVSLLRAFGAWGAGRASSSCRVPRLVHVPGCESDCEWAVNQAVWHATCEVRGARSRATPTARCGPAFSPRHPGMETIPESGERELKTARSLPDVYRVRRAGAPPILDADHHAIGSTIMRRDGWSPLSSRVRLAPARATRTRGRRPPSCKHQPR